MKDPFRRTFAEMDEERGLPPLPPTTEEEFPLPEWYRSVYHTPLEEFTVGDIARACRQEIHLKYIIPLALTWLRENPMQGEIWDGELLVALTSISSETWRAMPETYATVKSFIETISHNLPEEVTQDVRKFLALAEQKSCGSDGAGLNK